MVTVTRGDLEDLIALTDINERIAFVDKLIKNIMSLPKLPENQFWRVIKADYGFSEVWLMERRTKRNRITGKIKKYEALLNRVSIGQGTITEADIEYGVQRILARRASQSLYGDYPPKTLGENNE